MKINLILSSDEIEQLVHTHILNSGFDTDNKELDIDFVFDGEELSAVVSVEDIQESPKPRRTRRTRAQMEEDAKKETEESFNKDLFEQSDNPKFLVTSILVEPQVVLQEDPVEETNNDDADSSYGYDDAPFALTDPSEIIGSSDVEEPPKTKGIFD